MSREITIGDPRPNPLRQLVQSRLDLYGIRPSDKLGQNFLINQEAVDRLGRAVIPGNDVLDIGPGLGHVTEVLAKRAHKVYALEIDAHLEPALTDITRRNPNVTVLYGDAIAQDFSVFLPDDPDERGLQVVANIPFHITEPLMGRLKGLPIDNATLLVGQRFAEEITAPNEESFGFGRLNLLTQTYFDIEVAQRLVGTDFLPSAGTDAAIVTLTPKEKTAYNASLRTFILKRLFDTEKKNPSVKVVIKEALESYNPDAGKTIGKKDRNRKTRKKTRDELKGIRNAHNLRARYGSDGEGNEVSIRKTSDGDTLARMGLPDTLLNKRFSHLDRSDLRVLSAALRSVDRGPAPRAVIWSADMPRT